MDSLDSTASFAGLSFLSPGSSPASPPSPSPVPEQFAQQLQALSDAIADPQALAAELSASGLLTDAPTNSENAAALLEELAKLVTRLLKDGAIKEDEEPKPLSTTNATGTPESASSTDEPETSNTDGTASADLVTETTSPTPSVLTAALLQTLTVFVAPPVAPNPHSAETAVAETVTPPAGLIHALMPVLPPPTDDVAEPTKTEEKVEKPPEPTAAAPVISSPAHAALPALVPTPVAPVTTPVAAQPTSVNQPDPSVNPDIVAMAPRAAAPASVEAKQPAQQPIAFPETGPSPKSAPAKSAERSSLVTVSETDTPLSNVSLPETKTVVAAGSDSPAAKPVDRVESPTPVPVGNAPGPIAAEAAPTESRTLPPHDSARMVERLGQYVLEARDQGRQLTVQITPPDLGPLSIEVHAHHGELTARLATESTVAQQLLQEHLPQLHEALQHLGANVERIDVVRTEPLARDRDWDRPNGVGASTDWSASSGQSSSPDRREEPRRPNPSPRRNAPATNPVATTVAGGALQELNIRI